MSRDFTPRNLHAVDAVYGFSKNKFIISVEGEKRMLYDPDAPVSRRFPNLSFLFGGPLFDIMGEFGSDACGVLDQTEKRLDEIIRTDRGENSDPLYLWYMGKLDPGFYYREPNDELLREYIVSLIMEGTKGKEACHG